MKNGLKKDLKIIENLKVDRIKISNKEIISPCLKCKYRFICLFLPFFKELCPKQRGKIY